MLLLFAVGSARRKITVSPSPGERGKLLSFDQVEAYARAAGFPDTELATAIAMAESGGNPRNVGDNGTSFGLWQIHTPAHPEVNRDLLFDPTYNAKMAFQISKGGSEWTPWSAWKSGDYKRFLRKPR